MTDPITQTRARSSGLDALNDRSAEPSRRIQFRRELAGLPYDEQAARVSPDPVQMTGGSSSSGAASLEDRAREAPEWKDGHVRTHVTNSGLSVDPWALWLAIFKGIDTGDYSDFEAIANGIPFTVPSGTLCLWSGAGCKEKAEATGTELNQTDIGKLMAGFQFKTRPEWHKVKPLWETISRRYVTAARGEVHIFLGMGYGNRGGVRPEAVFGGAEKETLEELRDLNPAFNIVPIYHCVVEVGGAFTEPIGPFRDDPGSVPDPRSLFWATGNPGDVGKSNDDSKVHVRAHERGGQPVREHLRSAPSR